MQNELSRHHETGDEALWWVRQFSLRHYLRHSGRGGVFFRRLEW